MLCLIFSQWLIIASSACNYRHDKAGQTKFPMEITSENLSFANVQSLIFSPRCISCHGTSGGVNLETYASVKNHLSKIEQTTIINRTMPKSPFPSLTEDEIAFLSAWIKAGAPEMPETPVQPPLPLEPTFSSIKERIFKTKCLLCHTAGKSAARVPLETKEDLIDSPLEIVVPGDPDESGLMIAITRTDDKRMPPPTSGMSALTAEEMNVIRQWILEGANQ